MLSSMEFGESYENGETADKLTKVITFFKYVEKCEKLFSQIISFYENNTKRKIVISFSLRILKYLSIILNNN